MQIKNNNEITFTKNANSDRGGIDLNAKVEVPPGFGFAEGKWHFGQIVIPEIFAWQASDGKKLKYSKNGAPFKCDSPWIYAGDNPDTPNKINRDDSPGYPLDPMVDKKAQLGASFECYVMFQPAGGQYVPLKKLDWSCGGTATWNSTTKAWVLSGVTPPPVGAAPVDWSTHPEWTDRAPRVVLTNEQTAIFAARVLRIHAIASARYAAVWLMATHTGPGPKGPCGQALLVIAQSAPI